MKKVEKIEIDIKELGDIVIKRNVTIDALKTSLKILEDKQSQFKSIPSDPSVKVDTQLIFLRSRYNFIIEEIKDMVNAMERGDWYFSVENTAEREKEL